MNSPLWIINGTPGSGKSTTAAALAAALPRAAHIEGDRLQRMIISGGMPPQPEHDDEAERQIELCVRHQCLLAVSFLEAGFAVVIDYVVSSANRWAGYRELLSPWEPNLIVLAPDPAVAWGRDRARAEKNVLHQWLHLGDEIRQELDGVGRWIDNRALTVPEVVAEILATR